MNVSGIVSLVRRSAGVALVGVMLSPLTAVSAQDALPKIRLSQMVDPRWAWGNEARVRLDRDAFLVILEFGADRRVRMVYPRSPQDSPFTAGETQIYAELPSADAMFIRTSRVEVPTLVAIASDLAPDLSTFTAEGRAWDFDYEIPRGATRLQMIRSLAAIMFGGEDMPYSFEVQDLAPQLSTFARGALSSCGYAFGSQITRGFNNFLWQTFGPIPLHFHQLNGGSQWFHGVGGIHSQFGFFSLGFRRYVDNALWNQFGAGCDPLRRQRFFYAFYDPNRPGDVPPDNGQEVALAPLPKDRDPLARPPVVPDVGILPASPAEQARRGGLVADAVDKAVAAKPGTPVRTESQDLVQRTQVLDFIRQLTIQQTFGLDRNRVAAENNGPRRVQRNSGGSSSAGGVRRASAGGGSSGVGSSSGSSSSGGSVGSGGSSGGGSGRGGSAGGGRTGSGGRVPPN